jgi:hypothetical protein
VSFQRRRSISGASNQTESMFQKYIAQVAAWLEIIMGITLVMLPQFSCRLKFAASLDGAGVPITRFAGIGLLSLGIAYLAIRTAAASRTAVSGLLFSTRRLRFYLHGSRRPLTYMASLWPAVILHGAIWAVLLPQLFATNSGAN